MRADRENSIAACLIAKDAIDTIELCIRSIRPFVDEINVFDTGSSDGTLEFLTRAAAIRAVGDAEIRVVRGEWRDDFAWARQQSAAMASPDTTWLYWVDADDEVVGGEQIRRLAREAAPDVDGFLAYWDYARDADGNVTVERWIERLVRRASGFRWVGAIHEVLLPPPSVETLVLPVPRDQLRHVHRPSKARWEPSRNLAILRIEERRRIAEGSELDSRTLYYLGAELAWRGEFNEAAEYFERYVQRFDANDWSDQRAHAVNRLAACMRLTGRVERALELEQDALRHLPGSAELRYGVVESAAALGRWADVERLVAHAPPADSTSSSSQPVKVRLLPMLRLAEAMVRNGSRDAAIEAMQRSVEAAGGGARFTIAAKAVADQLAADAPAQAVTTIRELAAAYDPDLEAVVRGLRLAAEQQLTSAGSGFPLPASAEHE